MKYLKLYKVFESSDDDKILSDLDDICLELLDIGLKVSIDRRIPFNGITEEIKIIIKNDNNKYVTFSVEVVDTIVRINQYMKQLGWRSIYITNFRISPHIFVVRPDEKLRYSNGLWIVNTDQVINICLEFSKIIKSADQYDDLPNW
jgi:hypothetical protein